MVLPAFPDLSPATLRQIAEEHGFADARVTPLPSVGLFNAVFGLGTRAVLRIPRAGEHFIAALQTEAIAVPAARAAGVHTPPILVFDDTRKLLPVPYAIYERVDGDTLESCGHEPDATPEVYRGLGRDLALLHTGVPSGGPAGTLGVPNIPQGDFRVLPDQLAAAGYFSLAEARWLTRWLERLPAYLMGPAGHRFLHGDTQATNILVSPGAHDYRALIDWGGCGWADPALDFSGMPLRAVPAALAGYRETVPLPDDASAEARILRIHLHFALLNLQGGPQPGRSWGERPLGYLLEILRFFRDPPGERWRALRP